MFRLPFCYVSCQCRASKRDEEDQAVIASEGSVKKLIATEIGASLLPLLVSCDLLHGAAISDIFRQRSIDVGLRMFEIGIA